MATSITTGKRLVLKFIDGSYSFRDISISATNAELYGLAGALNAFQADKPPLKILSVTTRTIA